MSSSKASSLFSLSWRSKFKLAIWDYLCLPIWSIRKITKISVLTPLPVCSTCDTKVSFLALVANLSQWQIHSWIDATLQARRQIEFDSRSQQTFNHSNLIHLCFHIYINMLLDLHRFTVPSPCKRGRSQSPALMPQWRWWPARIRRVQEEYMHNGRLVIGSKYIKKRPNVWWTLFFVRYEL